LSNAQFANPATTDHLPGNHTVYCPGNVAFTYGPVVLGDCVDYALTMYGYVARTGVMFLSSNPVEFKPGGTWTPTVSTPGKQIATTCVIGGVTYSFEGALDDNASGGTYYGDLAQYVAGGVQIHQATFTSSNGGCSLVGTAWAAVVAP
jgi:hypothetical protein